MVTVEAQAIVSPDGQLSLAAQLPKGIAPGFHRVVVVVEEQSVDPYTPEERKQVEALAAGVDWKAIAARSKPPQSWFEETEDPFALPEEGR